MDHRRKSLVSTTFSVSLALMVYLLLLAVSNDNQKSWDLTGDKRFSFAEQTIDLMKSLPFKVKVYAFLDPAGDSRQAEDILDRYRRLNSNFSYEVVDMEKKPTLAESFQVRAYGQGVLEKISQDPGAANDEASRRERIMTFDEASLTDALLKLTMVEARKVYFLSGHGERASAGGDKDSLSALGVALGVEGYKAESLKLLDKKLVPKDCTVLVIAGPTGPLLPGEQSMIDDYLRAGGKLLFLADIKSPDFYSSWLKSYGFKLENSVIIDPASEMAKVEPVFAIGASYSSAHAITRSFKDITAFRLCRPVGIGEPPAWQGGTPKLEVLVSTAKTAFLMPISQILANATASLQADPKNAASHSMAVAGLYPRGSQATESDKNKPGEVSTRIVVIGDVDSFSDRLLTFVSNRDFILNSINWLAQSENQITVRVKDPKSQPIVLSKIQERWMSYIFGLLIPFLCALTGILIGFGRRRG